MAPTTRTSASQTPPSLRALLSRARTRWKGTTLIEVLFSVAILALIMVGVLQLFFVALQVNRGASARTQLTFKAQQVAENIRLFQFLHSNYSATAAQLPSNALSGIPTAFTQTDVGTEFYLPYSQTQASTWAHQTFWGPQGANVIEGSDGPVRLSYNVTDGGTTWGITVTAVPVDKQTSSAAFLGVDANQTSKRVQYVTSVPK